jgi:thymidine phosphorylase
MLLPQDIIRCKRDGGALSGEQIQAFVRGLSTPNPQAQWSDSQVAALAMATLLRGMTTPETVALTRAMTASGDVLNWQAAAFNGPVLDKHSTGGVGDKVSLMLAPILAACGAVVPMISGRGLGHTGGTLDKLQALPGYRVHLGAGELLQQLRQVGCAIVGASAQLAPADQRLYAIRDVTATVESVPLITASILSKKLAAGLQGLLLDVKVGSGAFAATPEQAQTLAQSLVGVATGAGLPARALITDMNQVLGSTAGNALEVHEALRFLTGAEQEPRLLQVTLALCAELLHLGGLAQSLELAYAQASQALNSGAAAERFALCVAAQGGPHDVLQAPGLPAAPVQCPVPALRGGFISQQDVRAIGQAVVLLGGGRSRAGDAIDPRVGFSAVLPLGQAVQAGQALALVHAADASSAQQAVRALQAAIAVADAAPGVTPLVQTVNLH